MRTRRERVLRALQRADGKWVCARSLIHPQCGGNRAGARIHELRKDGVAIERQYPCVCVDCRYYRDRAKQRGETPSHLAAWRLAPVADVA